MGKLADLAAVSSSRADSFVYVPPEAAFGATRILVKPNLGYPADAPVTVSKHVLGQVLRGLRRANSAARIVVLEGSCTAASMDEIYERFGVDDVLDDNMRAGDAEGVLMEEYPNLLANPVKYKSMIAPGYVGTYECCISVAAFKRTIVNDEPLISASLKNLYGLFPREHYHRSNPLWRSELHHPSVAEVLKDVYFTIGHLFDGAVVDLTHKYVSDDYQSDQGEAVEIGQVVWGDDLLAVDEVACRIAGEATASYIEPIRQLRREGRKALKGKS